MWGPQASLLVFLLAAVTTQNDRALGRAGAADLHPGPLFAKSGIARVVWHAFPGFLADLEINRDGFVRHGRLIVDATGRVYVEHLDSDTDAWVCGELTRVVQQSLATGNLHGGWDCRSALAVTWTRVGRFDLPRTLCAATAARNGNAPETAGQGTCLLRGPMKDGSRGWTLTLSNHRLLGRTEIASRNGS